MPVQVSVFSQFRGMAVAPEDVTFGEADSQEIVVNRGGIRSNVQVRRPNVVFTLRGILLSQAQPIIQEALANKRNFVNGATTGITLTLAGKVIRNALLVRADPSPTIAIAGQQIIETLELEFQSLIYE